MAELADALDSGSNGRKAVQVQVLLPAPQNVHNDFVMDIFLFSESKRRLFRCYFISKDHPNYFG